MLHRDLFAVGVDLPSMQTSVKADKHGLLTATPFDAALAIRPHTPG